MAAKKKVTRQVKKNKQAKPKNKVKHLKLKAVPKNASKTPSKAASDKVYKIPTPKAAFKQSEFFKVLAEQTALSTKEVKGLLEAIKAIAKIHLIKAGPGQFTIPGLCKLSSVTKPATKARKGRNPFTGEEMTFKAKPARKVIKAKALKKFRAELE